MVLLSNFSSDSGEACGKSLLHILSSNGSENGEGACMACWAVSGKCIPLLNQTHKTKADTCFLPFPFCILSCNLQENPGVRLFLKQRGRTRACQSSLGVFSLRALFKTPQRKMLAHKHQCVLELLCFAVSHNCAPHLKIFSSCVFFFLAFGLNELLLMNHHSHGEKWVGGLAPTLVPAQK